MNVLQGRRIEQAVSPEEVLKWFGKKLKPAISEENDRRFAAFINGCRWHGDPDPVPGDPGYIRPENYDEPDERWRDIEQTSNAAQLFLKIIPRIKARRENVHGSIQDQCAASELGRLLKSLEVALPHLNFPFGKVERKNGQVRASKLWHTYALAISGFAIGLLVEAGHERTSIARNSIVARVVQLAIRRMQIKGASNISAGAISAFLTRWDKRYGLTPQGIMALTTSETRTFYALTSEVCAGRLRSTPNEGAIGYDAA